MAEKLRAPVLDAETASPALRRLAALLVSVGARILRDLPCDQAICLTCGATLDVGAADAVVCCGIEAVRGLAPRMGLTTEGGRGE